MGVRTITFGESFGDTEDWDVVSFDGIVAGVNLDLSSMDRTMIRLLPVMVRWLPMWMEPRCLWYFAVGYITGDGARNILHGGAGTDSVSGGAGRVDLWWTGLGDTVFGGTGEDILIDWTEVIFTELVGIFVR